MHHGQQLCRRNSPRRGLTRRLRRGLGLAVPWGVHTFFRWRKKSVQKKASGTATPEAARPASRRGLRPAVALRAVLVLGSLRSLAGKKALYYPFWRRAFFPPLPIAALLRRSWRWAGLSLAGWDAFLQLGHFCSADKRADFLFPQSAVDRLIPCRLGCFGVSYIFLQRKRPAGFQIHAGLVKRTMRPVAEWRSVLCNWQGAIPDPRAARPSAERR